jgi:hypothetical protein
MILTKRLSSFATLTHIVVLIQAEKIFNKSYRSVLLR